MPARDKPSTNSCVPLLTGEDVSSVRPGPPPESAMVVDDDTLFCDALSAALEDEGLLVTSFQSPIKSLEASSRDLFDIAFLDINMPDLDGLELARRIMDVQPETRIVLTSGRGTFDQLLKAIKMGAYDFLPKPLREGDLQICLGRFRQRRDLTRLMRAAENRHSTLIQNIPLLVYRLRRDLSLEFINRTSLSMLGFMPEEAMSDSNWLLDRTHEDDRLKVASFLEQALESSTPLTMECRLTHKMGYHVHGILKTIPGSCEGNGADRPLDGIFMDISERVYLENALAQDQRMETLGAVTREVAHEIRNPLMAIAGFAKRLSLKLPDYPETGIILRESKRLENLLQRIRGYLEDPAHSAMIPTRINDLADAALKASAELLEKKELTVKRRLAEDLPEVETDPDMVMQVLEVIIQDAAKALEKGGRLTVRTFLGAGAVNTVLSYPLANLKSIDPDRIYLPFEEGGFGLPMCFRLVKKLGGLMSLSRERDRAVFTVSLPVPNGPASPRPESD